MSKYDICPDFECQNRVVNVEIQHSAQFQGQIGFRMSKYDIRPISNVEKDFECQITIFGPSSNVKKGL